jgi:hypothetical protein
MIASNAYLATRVVRYVFISCARNTFSIFQISDNFVNGLIKRTPENSV